ncbi:hypothetical protein [Phreatobacter stygius]|uniref:Uncharacterized protein n=1 Tax=Phreatobacter stygius TaxID=1940610 RepID=A0A4D7B1F9_9HYPH|nr:hypothetical protein [Phreatobacter stygius]QCI64568.1 hypothetical protein E8M01_10195 [Phreatobacter stygius]
MAVGQVGAPATGTVAPAGPSSGQNQSTGIARNEPPGRVVKTADVTVTLSPAARQHLSRTEGFAATIGTTKQPKAMTKPGISVDLSV